MSQEVPDNYYTLPFGKAAVLKTGPHITVVSYGAAVHWALETLEDMPHIKADLLDLRTLMPLDMEAIHKSVKKTGKCIILQEDTVFGGLASDIAASVTEACFHYLDGPVRRVGSIQTPIPFNAELEAGYLPKARFKEVLLELHAY